MTPFQRLGEGRTGKGSFAGPIWPSQPNPASAAQRLLVSGIPQEAPRVEPQERRDRSEAAGPEGRFWEALPAAPANQGANGRCGAFPGKRLARSRSGLLAGGGGDGEGAGSPARERKPEVSRWRQTLPRPADRVPGLRGASRPGGEGTAAAVVPHPRGVSGWGRPGERAEDGPSPKIAPRRLFALWDSAVGGGGQSGLSG